jgi:uridine kinase
MSILNCINVERHGTQALLQEFVKACDARLERDMIEVARSVSRAPKLKLLGLTGPTCSGKTTAANKLTDYLERHGHRVHVISIDDFYYDLDILHRKAEDDPNVEIDYDSEETIDVELLAQKAESLLACQRTELPRFDFKTGKRTIGQVIEPTPDDVFLFEGIQTLYPKVNAILEGEAYQSIYISPASSLQFGNEIFVPNEIRLMRRLVRDFRYRASEPEFTFYLWQSVRTNEEKSIFPNVHRCHHFIDSTMPYELGMLKPYLAEVLSRVTKNDQFYDSACEILRSLSEVEPIPSEFMTKHSLYKEFI